MSNIVLFGDSLLQGLDYKNQYIYPGYTTEQLIKELPLMEDIKGDNIVVSSGTNDLGHGLTAKETFTNLKILWQELRSKFRTIWIVAVPLLDSTVNNPYEQLNDLITDFILNTENFEFLDFYLNIDFKLLDEDGLHLNKTGIKELDSAIVTQVRL